MCEDMSWKTVTIIILLFTFNVENLKNIYSKYPWLYTMCNSPT